jgi:hypothetical protein
VELNNIIISFFKEGLIEQALRNAACKADIYIVPYSLIE